MESYFNPSKTYCTSARCSQILCGDRLHELVERDAWANGDYRKIPLKDLSHICPRFKTSDET